MVMDRWTDGQRARGGGTRKGTGKATPSSSIPPSLASGGRRGLTGHQGGAQGDTTLGGSSNKHCGLSAWLGPGVSRHLWPHFLVLLALVPLNESMAAGDRAGRGKQPQPWSLTGCTRRVASLEWGQPVPGGG